MELAKKVITEYKIDINKVYFKAFIDDVNNKERYYLCVTPLTFAFIKNTPNKKEMAKFLIQNGAKHSVEFSDDKESFPLRGLSPLSYAIIQNDIDLARFIIEELNAPLEEKDHLNFTPLMQAARSDTPEIAQLLIQKGALLDATGGERYAEVKESGKWTQGAGGHTALQIAACSGSIATAKVLLNAKCDLNIIDKNGCTALTYAIREKHKEITELLIQKGANPYLGATIKKKGKYYGESAIEEAVFLKNSQLMRLFYSERYDHIQKTETLLFDEETFSEEDDHVMEIKQFFHRQTDKVRLWRACRVGDLNELRCLLEANRNVEVSLLDFNANGNTALHLACVYHQWKAVQYILSKDDSALDAFNAVGDTPLIALLKSENPCATTLGVLLARHPDLEIVDKDNMTALMHAAGNPNKKLFELIWNVVKRTEFSAEEADPFFLLAVKANVVKAVTDTIKKGVNIDSTDENKKDALMIAAVHLDCKVAKLLISKGIKVEGSTEKGKTAFQYALKEKIFLYALF